MTLPCLYAPSRRGRTLNRWCGDVLVRHLGTSEAQAAMMVETWIKAGLLVVVAYRDPQQRRERTGVEVDNARRPTVPETTPEALKETFE